MVAEQLWNSGSENHAVNLLLLISAKAAVSKNRKDNNEAAASRRDGNSVFLSTENQNNCVFSFAEFSVKGAKQNMLMVNTS